MRHSDIRLTLGTYTDPRFLGTASAVLALPSLKGRRDAGRMKATGTYGRQSAELGAQLGVAGRAEARRSALPCREGAFEADPSSTTQLPDQAPVSNEVHFDSAQRAIGFEPTTSSLGSKYQFSPESSYSL
jgi:hypothetical protein